LLPADHSAKIADNTSSAADACASVSFPRRLATATGTRLPHAAVSALWSPKALAHAEQQQFDPIAPGYNSVCSEVVLGIALSSPEVTVFGGGNCRVLAASNFEARITS
jgi:hypothetical protein